MVKILHCADIHLDAPFVCGDKMKSELRRNELFATFSSMINYVKLNGIDLVLISGDLFESENVTRDTSALLVRAFADNPSCRFVISPGNHDPYTTDSVYAKVKFPPNVYIFNSPVLSGLSFDDINVDVYGYAFTSSEMEINPFKGMGPARPGRVNLLCAHGELTQSGKGVCPIDIDDIRKSGFDYVALGHIHSGSEVMKAGDTFYAYSGCLEGRDFGECGIKGAIYCELEKDRCELISNFKKIRFCKRRYEIERVNVSGAQNISDVLPAVKERIEEKEYGRDTLLRVILEGDVSPELVISKSAFTSLEDGLFYLETVNRTRPFYDIGKLANDPTVRGAFYEELKPMLESEDEKERELAYSALKYGLSALGGNNVIDF
ncbi:MAG: DNA repair exonuclease [Ruminococcaceae bacterium]|nr:DNA repair exonuclease [Oscillospiraceae bacterium]